MLANDTSRLAAELRRRDNLDRTPLHCVCARRSRTALPHCRIGEPSTPLVSCSRSTWEGTRSCIWRPQLETRPFCEFCFLTRWLHPSFALFDLGDEQGNISSSSLRISNTSLQLPPLTKKQKIHLHLLTTVSRFSKDTPVYWIS